MKETLLKALTILLCVFVGILFSYLVVGSNEVINNSNKITTPKVIYDYKKEMDNIRLQNKQLKDNAEILQTRLNNYEEDEVIDYESIENELYNELTKYDIIAGKMDVSGPGVEVIMTDSVKILESGNDVSQYIIHNSDVLQMINEIRFAGADVIALNGYQLKWDSNIDCAGPVIYIDDFIAGTPFRIEAIGDVDKITATLRSSESYVEVLRYRTINITINEKENIILKKN